MVFKDYTFFSYVFLVTAIILLAGHAHGAGLCDNYPNKTVCDSIVTTRTDPRDATSAACSKLVKEANRAISVAQYEPTSSEIDACIRCFEGAIYITKNALAYLNEGNYNVARDYISTTMQKYEGCDYAFQQSGKTNPLAKSTTLLKEMVSVGVYLAELILKSL